MPSFQNTDYRNLHWLVTGGCGFIGASLIRTLFEQGCHFIRVLDNLSVGTRHDLSRVCNFIELDPQSVSRGPESTSSVELLVGDIRKPDICISAALGIDVVVHLAANTGVGPSVDDPIQDMESNVIGTFNLLEATRQNSVKRFIFASSGAPIGECQPPIHEELAPRPVSPYGASKLSGEAYCSCYFRTFGIETISLRFGNVYGPGSTKKNSVIAKFIRQALAGETCEIYGDGTQTRDFIYIDDLIQAIQKSALYPKLSPDFSSSGSPDTFSPWGEVFQIATSREHTVNEVAEILKSQLNARGIQMKIKYTEPRLGDVRRNYSDTSKAKKRLNWSADIDLSDGLKQTVEWFIQES